MGQGNFQKYDPTVIQRSGLPEEIYDEVMKFVDELNDYRSKSRRKFYVLKEQTESGLARIRPIELGKHLAVDQIRRGQTQNLTRDPMYIEVEGDYFPDYFEENGIHFVSLRFWQYLKEKLILNENILYNRIGFAAEGRKRIEEYGLIIPEEVDCIIPDTLRTLRTGIVNFSELDDEKTGDLQIFKVKGFPHIVLSRKLNRVDFAGFECTRIENYFDYQGQRGRLYMERLSGQRLAAVLRELETRAEVAEDYSFKFNAPGSLEKERLRQELRQGLKAIFHGFNGDTAWSEQSAERSLNLIFSWEKGVVEVAKERHQEFTVPAFILSSLRPIREYLAGQAEEWQELGQRYAVEALLHLAAEESRLFDDYENIHGNSRFRLMLDVDILKTINPPLIYDYKTPFQQGVEAANDLQRFNLNNKDLRNFDFSGKDLTGMRFEGCNLECARFNNCTLTQAQFIRCNLRGSEFKEAQLSAAQFEKASLEWADFSGADLKKAVFMDSNLRHTKFIKTDLTKANITCKGKLSLAYFYKAKLFEAVITVTDAVFDCSFRLCDLRHAPQSFQIAIFPMPS